LTFLLMLNEILLNAFFYCHKIQLDLLRSKCLVNN
jgi:hypothetical protein